MTSAQIQGLQQQQQLQQMYLQQQQQQVTEPNNVQAHDAVPMENAVMYSAGKNMANHVSLHDGKAENHDELNQSSVPGSSSQENWPDAVQPLNGQILVPTCSENQFAKSSDGLTQTVTSSITTQGISLPLPGPFSQSESLFTEAHSDSGVSAMETSIAGDDPLMAVTEQQNSLAGPDALTTTSPLSDFVSTSSNASMFNSSVPSSQGTTLLQGESGTTATSEQSLSSGIHSTLLSEINCTGDVKPSPLTGTSDPTLSNGPMSMYTGFPSSAAGAASGISTISPFSPPSHYVMSPTQKSPFHTTASQLSPSLTQPLSIINPSCLSPSSGLQGGQSAFSPASLIPTDLLSPSKQLAVISPSSSSKSPFNLSSGGDNLAIPKLNLLCDSNALPHPPDTPLPPLPTDKLSPQTPSIYVSMFPMSLKFNDVKFMFKRELSLYDQVFVHEGTLRFLQQFTCTMSSF